MRKALTVSFLIVFSIACNLSAQQVEQVQRTLLTKKTASWCSKCGTWGWQMFEGLLDQNSNKAVLFAAHYSGDLINNTAIAITDNFGGAGQPIFYVNNEDQFVNSGNVSAKLDEVRGQVDANFQQAPLANAGIEATLAGTELTIKTKTRFFQATEGKYYLGLYILENNLVSPQAANSNTAIHQKVLRTAVTTDHFGQLIADGTVPVDTEVDHTFTYQMPSGLTKENTEIAIVIWKVAGGDFEVVNTFSTTQIDIPNSTESLASGSLQLEVQYATSGVTEVVLQLQEAQKALEVQLIDLQGRIVRSLAQGNFGEGRHAFQLSKDGLSKGLYLVRLAGDNAQLTRRVVVY